MIRDTFVMRNGELVPKRLAEPLMPTERGPQVISDTMPAMVHPSNGKMYDSKSRFRAETRARGLVEVGNETMRDTRKFDYVTKADIAQAIRELGG